MEHEYTDDSNYITYGDGDNSLMFIRRCPECSRFVKADKEVFSNGNGLVNTPNAVCSKHGAVQMPFLGFY